MAGNIVEYVLQITGGKSKQSIKKIAETLKKTQTQLKNTGRAGVASFKKLIKSSKKAQLSFKGMQMGLLAVAGAATASIAAFIALNQKIADSVNQIVDASTRSGIATETLAGLRLAAEGSGKSFKTLEVGLDAFSKQMLLASKGTGEAFESFQKLKVSVKNSNGELRDSNSVFNETIKSLSKMTNKTEKSAEVQRLFGKAGRSLLQSGAIDDLEKYVGLAKELGPAFDENGIKKAAEFQRGMAELKLSAIGALQTIMEGLTGEKGLGPSLSSFAISLNNFAGGFRLFMEKTFDYFAGLNLLVKKLGSDITDVIIRIDANLDLSKLTETALIGFGGGAYKERIDEATKGAKQLLDLQKEAAEKGISTDDLLWEKLQQAQKEGSEKIRKGGETQLAMRKNQLKRLTEIISKGEIKDFQAISSQLLGLKTRIQGAGETTKKIDALIEAFRKLRKVAGDKKELAFDWKPLTTGSNEAQKSLEDLNKEITSLTGGFKKEDPFGLSQLEDMVDPLKVIEDIEKADKSFAKIKKSIDDIGKEDQPFQSVSDDLAILRKRFIELGQSTIDIDKVKMKLLSLREEALKMAKMEVGLKVTMDVISMAKGDILGGVSGILDKSLNDSSRTLAGTIMQLAASVHTLGAYLMQAGQEKVQEVEKKREEQRTKELEEAFGRSLTEAEKQRVINETKLSEREKMKISDEAMREKAEEDIKNFSIAIETGIRMLPEILLGVLPPMLIDMALRIVTAIVQLPFRIVNGIVNGIRGIFEKIFAGPKEMVENLRNYFSDWFTGGKRSGGRFISARSGMRFTGAQDGLAMLHRNEYVVPESGARPQAVDRLMGQNRGITINVSADIVERDAIEELVRRIERKFQTFGSSQSSLFVS